VTPFAAARRRVTAVPVLAVFISVFVWGAGPIMTKAVDVSVNTTIFWRTLAWPPILWAVARWRGGRITAASLRIALVPGMFFGASTILGFTAFMTTSVANATLIGNVASAFTLFLAPRVLGERVRPVQVGLALCSFAGVALMVFGAGGTGGATLHGDALALGNAATWTVYFLSSKRLRSAKDAVDTWSFLGSVAVCQLVVTVPWALATSRDLVALSARDVLLIACMVLLPGTTGHGLMVWAQRHVAATLSSLVHLLAPVISAFLAWVIYDQGVNGTQALGGLVLLASLAGVVRLAGPPAARHALVDPAERLLDSNP
jgi:drug/metabolite transporter (DMT)-like permease